MLKSLDKYILRQFLTPFILILTVLTLVIWMTQTLQRLELLVDNGQNLGYFLYLSILVIPSLLVVLIPFSMFGACIYALYRMHVDSEIAVMFATGISRTRVALPILIVTFFGALATLYIALDLSPRTYRTLKQNVINIRSDVASSVLRSGEFIKIIDGFTIYVQEVNSNNQFTGLLVNDYRNPEQPRTYLAQRGVLRNSDNGPVLILAGGNFQRLRKSTGEVQYLPFEETRINIASVQGEQELQLELTERYLSELLDPDLSNEWEQRNQGKMLAEAHNRLTTPFHIFAYVLIALYALIGGAYSRRGYGLRAALAGIGVIGIKILGYMVKTMAETSNLQWLQYAIPIVIICVVLFLLFDINIHRIQHLFLGKTPPASPPNKKSNLKTKRPAKPKNKASSKRVVNDTATGTVS